MVALAILAAAGVGILQLTRESAATVSHVRTAELNVAGAAAILDVLALSSREVLDQRLGQAVDGAWLVTLERQGAMYRVTVSDTSSRRVLLETQIFRRAPVQQP
jgi:hypothetical protein